MMSIAPIILISNAIMLSLIEISCGCTEEEAKVWIVQYNKDASKAFHDKEEADWTYSTNLTDYNSQQLTEKSAKKAEFAKKSSIWAKKCEWKNFEDSKLSRQFSKIVDIDTDALPDDKYRKMLELHNDMRRIYSTAKICNKPGDKSGTCYPLDPDLTNLFEDPETDWDTLLWAWEGWRNETGRKMPDSYKEFTDLLNEAAVLNGYKNAGEAWRSTYETDTFVEDLESLWLQLKPLYEEVHAYVRRKLIEKYPTGKFPKEGHIPAHLLGNMWAQQWMIIEPVIRPYPKASAIDVTEEMKKQKYTAEKMFKLSEEFFTSLGLIAMPQTFWDNSVITKPEDRDVVCSASSWDLYNAVDFRIKQCTEITQPWLLTTHHEMGHIEYFMQYKNQPINFRMGANDGFHEAIGDTMSLSVATPEHLQKIGLLHNFVDNPNTDINFLMDQALTNVAFMPFGYLIDKWRWDLFAGEFSREEYNDKWWEFRCRYQGLSPPVSRSTSKDFDPGAKFHVPNNTPYIRYFVSHILQYQFHEALCKAAGNMKPLHRCDIYQSKAAGKKLGDMLKVGSSIAWPDALKLISGTKKMSAEPLLEYFKPLTTWLKKENKGHPKGWTDASPPGSIVP